MTKVFLALILAIFTVNACLAQKTEEAKQLDGIFKMLYEQNQFNGSVLIADKGEIVFEKGYGYRDETTKQPNNADTIFELASVSKQFTAMGIVLLKREGKLNYDDKLTKHFPELSGWDNVTIYNLLRHTSGIPEYFGDFSKDWDKTKIATNADVINYYALKKKALEFEPGSRHRYCNTNYVLLASIIEKVSGEKFGNFLAEHIFKPLRMKNTFVYNRRQSPRKLKNYATGYVWAKNSFQKVTSEQPEFDDRSVYYLDGIVGNAKVNSTVKDLFKWINAVKNQTFISEKEFEEITEITKTSGGKNIPYGFGFEVAKGENKFSFGHTGSWDGYMTFIYQNMIKDRTIIILQNFKMSAYSFDNINQILDKQPVKPEFRKKINLPESEIIKFTGVYTDEKNKDEQHQITYKNGHLFYNTNKIPWDMRFFPVAENEFQALRIGGRDGVLRFTKLENGSLKLEMLEDGKVIGTGIR